MAVVLTGLFNLGMNMVAVLVFALAFGVEPTWTWLLFPVVDAGADHPDELPLDLPLRALRPPPRRRRSSGRSSRPRSSTAAPCSTRSRSCRRLLRHIMFVNPLVPLFVQTNQWMIDPDAPSAVDAAGGWARARCPRSSSSSASARCRSGTSTARRRGWPRSLGRLSCPPCGIGSPRCRKQGSHACPDGLGEYLVARIARRLMRARAMAVGPSGGCLAPSPHRSLAN